MKRKVIKQANQAYTITLPIEWVRKNKIDEKTELEVNESEKSLILLNTGEVEHKKISIDVTNFDEINISRIIKALYARGIDEIEIISDKNISSFISKDIHNTIGYALVSQKDNRYVIKDLGGGNYSELDEIFKRVFQMILLFYESAIDDVFGKQKESLDGLIARDGEINKFSLFLQRAINKMSYPDQIKGRLLFTYSFEIEIIGDEIQRFWRTNIKYNIKKTEQLKKLAQDSLKGLEKAFEFYFQFNPKIAEEIKSLRDKVREDSLKLEKLNKYDSRFARHIVKIIEEAADLSHLTLMIKL
jgi:phosphate uptake regulator